MTPNELIAASYRMSKSLFHRYVDNLTVEEFHHQPVAGANSATWIVGHLAATLRRTLDRLGATDLPAHPEILGEHFAQTGKVAGTQAALGDPKELLTIFDDYIERVIAAVAKVAPEKLDEVPTARVGPSNNFGEGILFGSIHVAMHAGQLTIIRRSLGRAPVV